MANKAAVSIIIPVYNVEKYLARCLDSVLSQTFKDFEVICINDGSPDSCARILEDYAKKDRRVKIITQQNQGQAAARNKGLALARGEFIYFVDSDDFIHPQLLEIALYFIKNNNADWVTFKYDKAAHKASKKVKEGAVFTYNPPLYKNIENIPCRITENPLLLFKKNFTYKMTCYVWARLYRKDLLKGISFLPGNSFEDDPFILAVCAKRPKTVLLDEPLYYYIDNPRSVTNRTRVQVLPRHIEDYHKALLYIYEKYKKAPRADFNFVAANIAAKKLRQQYAKIKTADKANRAELYKAFKKELKDLVKKGFVPFSLNPRNLFYWFKYRKLIRGGQK